MAENKVRKRNLYMAAAGLVVVLITAVFTSGLLDYTSRPSFCGSCHMMQTRYVSWKRSLHNSATCFQCHSEPGIKGEMDAKLNGMKYLFYELKGYRGGEILKASVSNKSCMRCHTMDEMDEKMHSHVSPVQHILVSHRSHVENLGISCTECHGNIMHVNLQGDAKKAVTACGKCHKQTDFVNLVDRLVF